MSTAAQPSLFDAPAAAAPLDDRGAELSPCLRYRYRLWRRWAPGAPLVFCMLNPSTADATEDDPTIRRCIGFARRDGYPAIEVVNLFAFRATDPAELPEASVAVGTMNDAFLRRAFTAAALVVAAWGAHPLAEARARVVAALAPGPLHCLGVTKSGAPRHPLYVRGDQALEVWRT